jgi:hypothetical protein
MPRTLLIIIILLSAVLLSAFNIFCHALVVQELTGTAPPAEPGLIAGVIHSLGTAIAQRPQWVYFFSAAPLVVGVILALLVGLSGGRSEAAADTTAAATDDGATAGALRLLALLQQEGRLIDFVEEDIAPYDDAQVGAAVRAIHSGCRKALHDRMRIERIFADEDGAQVDVPNGFDSSTVRLTGNVHGQPPFRGVLQHGGWRATAVTLPRGAGVDPAILAPAEIEVS